MDVLFAALLQLINETLAAAIVIVAASILLYNLTRNLNDRVARTSSIVLGCVTLPYIADVLIALGPGAGTFASLLRLQWVGIAFMPVALYHLSDALLATTGLPSRGRRRRVIRILYLIGAAFLVLAAFTRALIQPTRLVPAFPVENNIAIGLLPGDLLWLYLVYFVIITAAAFYNVERARRRCLTRRTRRRMGYLQIAMLTPAVGIFPFSLLLGAGSEYSVMGLLLVNIANIVVILMLLFLAYPLSFFGSRVPDRIVKTELLRFLLRGPATGLLALATILFTTPATRILGLPGINFMPFAVVTAVLLWQWLIDRTLPYLERRFVYAADDYDQLTKIADLSERLLTRADLIGVLEAILASLCDSLRVTTAFVAAPADPGAELIASIGGSLPNTEALHEAARALAPPNTADDDDNEMPAAAPSIVTWSGYWLMPLLSVRGDRAGRIGFLGVQARAAALDLDEDEFARLAAFILRAARALDDLALQTEISAALEGLLPQISMTRTAAAALEFGPARAQPAAMLPPSIPDIDQFKEQVRVALRHYWGGPGMSDSRLLDLAIVKDALPASDRNPVRALRTVLAQAIATQKPDGEPKLTRPEWMLYLILEMRVLQKVKVADAAYKMSLSEPDFYRKQRVAIDAVAETLLDMERQRLNGGSSRNGLTPDL